LHDLHIDSIQDRQIESTMYLLEENQMDLRNSTALGSAN